MSAISRRKDLDPRGAMMQMFAEMNEVLDLEREALQEGAARSSVK